MNDWAEWTGLEKAIQHATALRDRRGPIYGVGVAFQGVKGAFFCPDMDDDLKDGPSDRLRWLMLRHPTWATSSTRRILRWQTALSC